MKHDRRIEELETRLAQAWRETDGPALDGAWRSGVMDAVRAEAEREHALAGSRASKAASVDRVVRNAFFAAVAAAVLAALLVGTRAAALDPTLELARLFADDPRGFLELVLVL